MKKSNAGVKDGGARVKIPARVESATLARFFAPGEPAVVLKLPGIGNTAPFYLQDKAARILVLKWDSRMGGHVIRIPHSLWHANEARLAHDVMEQERLVNGMVVTFELRETSAAEGKTESGVADDAPPTAAKAAGDAAEVEKTQAAGPGAQALERDDDGAGVEREANTAAAACDSGAASASCCSSGGGHEAEAAQAGPTATLSTAAAETQPVARVAAGPEPEPEVRAAASAARKGRPRRRE